ncbi:hypothetical protein HNR22_000573 [Micromonospora jinlongensis]|uniref:Uncharacterized protein n=1 Tax=Micromonospora jinlongensis TaxID=1287877 RepID=A0A7Y9WWI2_9ACTN|nr:hypothetical protein [Micromonospora jinlongensis]
MNVTIDEHIGARRSLCVRSLMITAESPRCPDTGVPARFAEVVAGHRTRAYRLWSTLIRASSASR